MTSSKNAEHLLSTCQDLRRVKPPASLAPGLLQGILVLLVLICAITPVNAALTDKNEYTLGEQVLLGDVSENYRITIIAPEARYRMLGTQTPFTPRTPGNYTIIISDENDQPITQDIFTVKEAQVARTITISPTPAVVNQDTTIKINPVPQGDISVIIHAPHGKFRYSGRWNDATFQPKDAGTHEIIITENGIDTGKLKFEVIAPPTTPNTTLPPNTPPVLQPNTTSPVTQWTIKDSKGKIQQASVRFVKQARGVASGYDMDILPQQRFAKQLYIRDISASRVEIGLEEVPLSSVKSGFSEHTAVLKAYAVNLDFGFSTATMTSVAEGTTLYKCAGWNFTLQQCSGGWQKVQNLVPGQEYNITLFPGDPGYVETGVATINSLKPIYHPNETATLLMAVLDTRGFLVSGASVTLTVTNPAGVSTVVQNIQEIATGIYEAHFSGTALEGNYTLFVDAKAKQVNTTMFSSFSVQASYPFDIIRNTPVTTDPFQGPFDSEITITPFIEIDQYDFTEVLPVEFTVVSAPGAAIASDAANTYLTWQNLSGNATVSYTAQPPKITPNLFALGTSFITYMIDGITYIFDEARAWFLAIDPEVTRDQGLLIYGDRDPDGSVKFRNWTGALGGEQDSGLAMGDRTTWFRFRCSDTRNECLMLNSDGGNDLNFAVFDTSTWLWRNSTQLDNNIGQDDQQQFDVECEDLSGDCLIAFEDSTAADATFQARIWNASGLQAASTITVTGGESLDFLWLEMYPQKGTDRIGIAVMNDGGGGNGDTPGLYAGIWNGTAFGNWRTLTTNGVNQGNARNFYKQFDCGWEGNTSYFLCVYDNNSINGVLMDRWNGTNWSYVGNIYNVTGDEVLEFAVCGQEPWSTFSHNDVGIMFCDDGSDLDGGIWNGTNFSKTATTQSPGTNTAAECGANKALDEWGRPFECRWERSGDQAIFLWVAASNQDWLTAGTYTRSTQSFSMANWSTGTQVVADAAGNLRMVQLVPNQGSDSVFVVYADGSSDGGCSYWSGTSWDNSICNNGATFETNGARGARQWVTFDWFRTPPPQPEIEIITPNGTRSLVNYSNTLNPSSSSMAWDGATTELPPAAANSPISGTEFSSQGYVNVSASDDVRHSSVATGAPTGRRAYQSFNFSVNDSTVSMSSIKLTHEGYATEAISQAADQFYIYFYSWANDSYVLQRTIFASSVDVTTEITLTSAFSDYIRNRQMLVLVEGDFTLGAGANARAEVATDYIGLTIDSIAVLRGNQTINASAVDDDGIGLCEWAALNSSGGQVSNLTRMVLSNGNYYFNITDTRTITDGNYNLTVFCNDTSANRKNATERVRIDNTAPNILIYTPANESNFTVNHVLFAWNVTDIAFENMVCNITIDGSVSASNIIALHGDNTTRNITSISDGSHSWSITCVDDAGNTNTTATRVFEVDTAAPTITLISPSSSTFLNNATVNFTFNASDTHLANCSLRLDGVINATLVPTISNAISNITISNLAEGLHRWNITCIDTFRFSSNSTTRNFTVDVTKPVIHLNTSNGIVFNNTLPQLNYTAIDNLDTNMTCNLSVDNVVTNASIPSLNNTLVSISVDLPDGVKFWNVTCMDDANNVNSSVIRTFTVVGGPYVELQSPGTGYVTNGTNINFTYYTEDGDGVRNCSLLINNAFNITNSTPVINEANNSIILSNLNQGYYTWNIECFDISNTSGTGGARNIVVDRTKPFITLNGPSAGTTINATPTLLNFTFTDSHSPNATCNVTLDNVVVATGITALNNTLAGTSQTIINGLHLWNVTCIDLGGNFNTSLTQNFTVNVTFPLNVTVIADKETYVITEVARINISIRNESSHLVSANITTDYIYTNNSYTDVPWWNTSWLKRKPIYINETNGTKRTNKMVAINVTGLFGSISNCQNEIRVISDVDLTMQETSIINGDDVSYCYIAFNATVSANANNEQNYHVYYNNSGASAPTYSDLLDGVVLFSDNFQDGNTVGWTAGAGWDTSTDDPVAGIHAHIDGVVTDITMRPAQTFSLSQYDAVNISFVWQIDTAWDAGEYIRVDFTNNSESTWTASGGIVTLDGNVNEGVTEREDLELNNSYKVDGFNIRFRSTTNDAAEDGGFDDFNITAYYFVQINTTSAVGEVQIWLERNLSQANSTGNVSLNFTTTGRVEGNYSVVARATTNNPNNRPGTGYDWFRIIQDQLGPVINLTHPANATTNHTGNIIFRYTAFDIPSLVKNCSLYINNIYNQTNATPVNESSTNNFTINSMAQGEYQWKVVCYDTVGFQGNSSTFTLWLDDTAPNILLYSPNGTTASSSTVQFSFNVTDNIDTSIFCNISIDNWNYSATLNAVNGSNTSVNISGIADGFHRWNVTCFDNINNNATSATYNFTIDSVPILRLHSPVNNSGFNVTNISLFYNLTESSVANCSLILNGVVNQTNSSPILYVSNDGSNNFTVNPIGTGIFNWTVICYDTSGSNGTDTQRTFHIDNALPNVTLNRPTNGETLYTSTVTFNFTATDAVDTLLNCNLTLNGVANKTNINATNGTATLQNVTGLTAGTHLWNVSCSDNVGFTYTSATWNFTLVAIVNVVLNSPANNSLDGDGNLTFTYTPQSLANFLAGFCELYLDGVVNDTHISPVEGVGNTFTVNNIAEGTHNWYVNCTDSASNNNISETRMFIIDSADPVVLTYYPNGTTLSSSTVLFNWSTTDNLDTSMICNVRVNGSLQTPGDITSLNNTLTNATYSGFTDGYHIWNVTCMDDALRNGTSSLKNFTIAEPPKIVLGTPANGNRTRNQSIMFFYTPSDNSGTLANCTLVLNNVLNQTNTSSLTSGSQANLTVLVIPEGTHNWTFNCTDPSGNRGTNLTGKLFTIDLTGPHITLSYPINSIAINTNNVTFNWTAIDTSAPTITCNMSVTNASGLLYSSSSTHANGSVFNATINELADGAHNWSVICVDDVGNMNTSVNGTFLINQPDLFINDSRLSFNNTNPGIGQEILIFANVTNIGGVSATNVLVNFWDGLPGSGVFIGNATVASIAQNTSYLFNVSWNVTPGYHNIWVIVDPNSTVAELNESNNNATINISAIHINITHPENNSVTIDNTPRFDFNATDFTNNNITYRVYVDGTFNGQTGNVTSGSNTTIDLSALTDGLHRIIIQGTDTLGRSKNSTAHTITIDTSAPVGVFVTRNGTFFKNSTPIIEIRINDTLDAVINYSILVNGSINVSGSVQNATNTNVTLIGFTNGTFNLTIQSFDDVGNYANSSSIIIYVDSVSPTITPNAPADNANFSVRTVLLNYTAADNLDPILGCFITLDNSVVQEANVTNGNSQTYTATNLYEGTHLWNATCWDGLNEINQINNNATSVTRTFGVYIGPNITLISPANNGISNNATQLFFFNASDDTGLANCSILINGILNTTNSSSLILNGTNNITVSGLNNTFNWSVLCYDNSSGRAFSYSENRTFTVDSVAPVPVINTANNTWFNNGSPNINITITDNYDTVLNWIFYVNSVVNASGTVNNGTATLVGLVNLTNGTYTIILQGLDDAGNYRNSTSIIIYVDSVAPNVTLMSPANNTTLVTADVLLNFTVNDNMASVLICNLTLDNTIVAQLNVTNNTFGTYQATSLAGGFHYWNATCIDNASNTRTSNTWNFYIELPDFAISTGNITFSNNTPVENQTIQINATVFNVGLKNYTNNITVQFWNGDPDNGGVQINGNLTIQGLNASHNATVNVSYTTSIGLNQIYVVVDPPTNVNGSIVETNESNNKANRSIWVGLFEVFAGGQIGTLHIADSNILAAFNWNQTDVTGSNVFVADSQSSISFTSLHAIGRNITNGTSVGTNDFEEIDTSLNTTSLNDSVNLTFTVAGQPLRFMNITAFKRHIGFIPAINSTNTTSFTTGILWDTSDGGSFYNRSQDIVFVTLMNQSMQGRYGVYDYEIAVPAKLRDYITGGGTVTFYTELK